MTSLLRRLLLLLGIGFLLSALGIVTDGLTDEGREADLGIVFGNTVEVTGTPSPRLQARLDTALALHQQGLVSALLVSGGVGREGHDEALIMQRYLVERGVPSSAIFVDSEGLTTYLTARHAARLMEAHDMRRAIVVSQYFHIPRARLALERFGISPVYGAHAPYFEPRDLYSTAREVVAFYSYLTREYPSGERP